MRALAPEVRFAPLVLKTVPQWLKPSLAWPFSARLNPCPSFDSLSQTLRVGEGFMCQLSATSRSELQRSDTSPLSTHVFGRSTGLHRAAALPGNATLYPEAACSDAG
jgi:hypothetical protein